MTNNKLRIITEWNRKLFRRPFRVGIVEVSDSPLVAKNRDKLRNYWGRLVIMTSLILRLLPNRADYQQTQYR